MAAATKATPTLADYLDQRAPEPSDNISTRGLNRLTGVVNDPYRVGNLPSTHVACAFSENDGQLSKALSSGWIAFEPERVTNKDYETDKAYIPVYNVENGFVVVGFGKHAMTMCFANKTIVRQGRERLNGRWNAQFASRMGTDEEARAAPKKDTGYKGGFTSELGTHAAVGYEESTVNISPDNPTSELFSQPEGGL